MSKSTKIVAGVVAGLGLAALPLGAFAVTPVADVEDTVEIIVDPACSINDVITLDAARTGGETEDDRTFSDTVVNGGTAAFEDANGNSSHQFTIVCNNDDGWQVSASGPTNLSGASGNAHVITYQAAALPASASTEGVWNAIVSGAPVSAELDGITTVSNVNYIATSGGVIATEAASTDGSTFSVTYGAVVGTETAADTYTGTVTYTLATL